MDGEKFDGNDWKKGVHELFEKLVKFGELSTDEKKKYRDLYKSNSGKRFGRKRRLERKIAINNLLNRLLEEKKSECDCESNC